MVRCHHGFALTLIPSSLHFSSKNSFLIMSCPTLRSSLADFCSKLIAASLWTFSRSEISLIRLSSSFFHALTYVGAMSLSLAICRIVFWFSIASRATRALNSALKCRLFRLLIWFYFRVSILKNQLFSSTRPWLRFLGLLQL